MRTVRLPLLRGALFIIALAAISILLARGDNPASATSYEPSFAVSVSDANPGAAADIVIDFSVDAPDSFPNVKTNSSIQFIPTGWGIHKDAPVGGIAGTFNALTNLSIFGYQPCIFTVPVPFTMMDAAVDTSIVTSTLDVSDTHPGGPGFSGQFAPDPDTVETPTDLNLPLIGFNADEKANISDDLIELYRIWDLYRDVDGSGSISVGDVRLTDYETGAGGNVVLYPAGTVAQPGDEDLGIWDLHAITKPKLKHSEINGNGQMDPGEFMYKDNDNDGKVSYGDKRMFKFAQLGMFSIVELFQLPGGVHRYPDFLNQMIPPSVVGDPLARMFAIKDVLGTPVSLNIVTYRPGQLPGYPDTLGYPNVVVLLDPVAPIEAVGINLTSDMCTPLSLTSTNLGVSQDNAATAADEGGYVRLTNPKAEKDHTFTLVTTSQPDADNDGIENMLDTCPFTANTTDPQSRTIDPDYDGLDGSCDPAESPPPDLGQPLVSFNGNEKKARYYALEHGALYRDKDWSGTITPGDDRLMVRQFQGYTVQPGVVQDSDADYRNPVTGTVWASWIRQLERMFYQTKHAENVAANGLYDVGENIYWDVDDSNDVSPGDRRTFYNGTYPMLNYQNRDRDVLYLSPSPFAPWFSTPDEDQDNYGNRADNCPLIANGIEVIGQDYKAVPGFWFPWAITSGLIGPDNQADTDGDDIGDACEGSEAGGPASALQQCANATDDDGDGVINDGCPRTEKQNIAENGDQCLNAVDDDGDGYVNDGCVQITQGGGSGAETGDQCLNDISDDGDAFVNDGCPAMDVSPPELCDNATDDDLDGFVNDGCPAVDPGDVAKTTPTGHMHVVTLTQDVPIVAHGITLKDLNGKNQLKNGGSAEYAVIVNNTARSPEDIPVALKVEGGCGAVDGVAGQNTQTVRVNGNSSKAVKFTVDFTGCLGGEYIVRADACHAGDPTGLFGSSPCPGASDVPQPPVGQLTPSGATASWESSDFFGYNFAAKNVTDNLSNTSWCDLSGFATSWIQVAFDNAVSVSQVVIENAEWGAYGVSFATGTLSFSNGYSQDVTLDGSGAGSFSVPLQSGVTSVRFTGPMPAGYACMSEFKTFGFTPVAGDPDPLDDAPMAMSVEVGP